MKKLELVRSVERLQKEVDRLRAEKRAVQEYAERVENRESTDLTLVEIYQVLQGEGYSSDEVDEALADHWLSEVMGDIGWMERAWTQMAHEPHSASSLAIVDALLAVRRSR